MLVPAVVPQILAQELDEPHTALDHPPGQQALPSVDFRCRITESVELGRGLRFARQVDELRNGRLHAEGQFVIADRRFESIHLADSPKHPGIKFAARGRAYALLYSVCRLGPADVGHGRSPPPNNDP